jgi:hypothetical protein
LGAASDPVSATTGPRLHIPDTGSRPSSLPPGPGRRLGRRCQWDSPSRIWQPALQQRPQAGPGGGRVRSAGLPGFGCCCCCGRCRRRDCSVAIGRLASYLGRRCTGSHGRRGSHVAICSAGRTMTRKRTRECWRYRPPRRASSVRWARGWLGWAW